MFNRTYNRARLDLEIETVTPLAIRAGDPGLDPGAADLVCVKTHHAVHGRSVYIPGSSLKGVVRAAAEAAIRGQKLAGVDGACDVFDRDTACGFQFDRDDRGPTVYKGHCGACRTFGSTAIKGRTAIRDLFPWPRDGAPDPANLARANRPEVRHSVAINRISGAVQNGPFDQEMVPAGVSFFGEIALENYQVWQLGLLATGLEELNDGFAQLGSTKSRGLGVVKVKVLRIVHDQSGSEKRAMGVADLAGAWGDQYGLLRDASLPETNGALRGIRRRFVAEGDIVQSWLDAGLNGLSTVLGGGS